MHTIRTTEWNKCFKLGDQWTVTNVYEPQMHKLLKCDPADYFSLKPGLHMAVTIASTIFADQVTSF